jgi:hypothetical protein
MPPIPGSLISTQFLAAESPSASEILAESAPSLQFRVDCQKLKQEFALAAASTGITA